MELNIRKLIIGFFNFNKAICQEKHIANYNKKNQISINYQAKFI